MWRRRICNLSIQHITGNGYSIIHVYMMHNYYACNYHASNNALASISEGLRARVD